MGFTLVIGIEFVHDSQLEGIWCQKKQRSKNIRAKFYTLLSSRFCLQLKTCTSMSTLVTRKTQRVRRLPLIIVLIKKSSRSVPAATRSGDVCASEVIDLAHIRCLAFRIRIRIRFICYTRTYGIMDCVDTHTHTQGICFRVSCASSVFAKKQRKYQEALTVTAPSFTSVLSCAAHCVLAKGSQHSLNLVEGGSVCSFGSVYCTLFIPAEPFKTAYHGNCYERSAGSPDRKKRRILKSNLIFIRQSKWQVVALGCLEDCFCFQKAKYN